MNSKAPATRPGGEVVVYEAADGEVQADVRFDRETIWLTQQQMAELFGRDRSVVTQHVRNAFREGELNPEATRAKFALIRSEGGRTVLRDGYRVRSLCGAQCRINLLVNPAK